MQNQAKWYYYVFAAPIYLLMLLPLPVLYLLSNCLTFLAYHIIKYRKKVVFTNLHNAFPDKSEQEIIRIAKMYYRNMIDVFIETFKTLTLSEKQLTNRVKMENTEFIKELHKNNKSVVLLLGHLGNWEWGGFSYTYQLGYPVGTLYHPLTNKFFDWLMYKIRAKCGVDLIAMQQSARNFADNKNIPRTVAFIADQSPQPAHAYWTNFLNQDTGFFPGAEKLARKYNCAVAYADIAKPKRGHYIVKFQLLTDNSGSFQPNQITQVFADMLAASIQKDPEFWLWSHRRWKHKRPTI
ncbi:MAG: lysophospholipid acyltransferase family protein [Bacteroidia bacterium]|nr:lysophospholipid acyltransferase family protein [Bacteroidia bacterium]